MKRLLFMGISLSATLFCIWLVFAVSFDEPARPASKEAQHLHLQACGFQTAWSSDFELKCYLYYPEWPSQHIAMPVNVYRQKDKAGRSADKTELPVLYLPGGPGEMYTTDESMHHLVEPWLEAGHVARDVVLMDFRGNAPGKPFEPCPAYVTAMKSLLREAMTYEAETEKLLPELTACLNRFAHQLNANEPAAVALKQLSTQQNAEDTQSVMRALGYTRWHLAGVSYGTRVAIEAALTQDAVDKLILDSVYVPFDGQTSTDLLGQMQAFERVFDYCRIAGNCGMSEQNASLEALFWQAYEQLGKTPLVVSSENWDADSHDSWVLTQDRFVGTLFYSFYTSEYLSLLPNFLTQALNGGLQEHILLDLFYNAMIDRFFNDLVFYATECHDNQREAPGAVASALNGLPVQWQALMGPIPEQDLCDALALDAPPEPTLSQGELRQFSLVVSGGLDPVTSLMSAQKFVSDQPQASLITLPHHAHAEFFWDYCGAQIVEQFFASERLEAASVQAQLRSCLEDRFGDGSD